MPYATALTLVEGGRLLMAGQNALRFHGRVAYDDRYEGLALDDDEGRRIASQLSGKTVMFMASHGVTVVGPSIAWAFDDLYYLERACMHQVLATQAAAGKPLRIVDDALAARVAEQVDGERQQSDMYFASIKRMLDHEGPGWSTF
jgi:ribulose-5-phosphate 4-epimerase/fuculose-1-phosphate aldolase